MQNELQKLRKKNFKRSGYKLAWKQKLQPDKKENCMIVDNKFKIVFKSDNQFNT